MLSAGRAEREVRQQSSWWMKWADDTWGISSHFPWLSAHAIGTMKGCGRAARMLALATAPGTWARPCPLHGFPELSPLRWLPVQELQQGLHRTKRDLETQQRW